MSSENGSGAQAGQPELPSPEGLEGVVAATTALSHVFGEEGRLVYRGYDIHELAGKASFEEVAYLLWLGHLPNAAELADLQRKLDANRGLPAETIAGAAGAARRRPSRWTPCERGSRPSARPIPTSSTGTPNLDEAIALAARFPAILADVFPPSPGAGAGRAKARA